MPAEVQPMKVIVASPSRSGTLGLYQAMQILGFRTYHLVECIANRGLPHMEVFEEAVTAEHNSLSGIKKYDRADYDRWLGDYSCIVEVPSYLGTGLIEAYVNDPDVKFILTERNPEKWATSINKTIGPNAEMSHQFPFLILKYFNATMYHTHTLIELIYRVMSKCTARGEAENVENIQKHYTEYVKKAKEVIPADRLCHIQLEDGLGWENICPFLDLPIPEQAYPGRNEPEKMHQLSKQMLKPMIMDAVTKLSAIAIPVVGITCWAAMKYGPKVVAAVGKPQ
ncbi:unnamed protein product [Penicillium olsonii]|nr:unnamed protein product [Penicillium olsonii]CAG7929681.1 unnamed protein product [Penicillium olsonii]